MATISQPILDLEVNAIGGTPNFSYHVPFHVYEDAKIFEFLEV